MKSIAAFAIILAVCSQVEDNRGGHQQNRTREFGPRTCGPADPSHIRIANETGGQPFFLNPSELAASAHIMREQSLAGRELILWAHAAPENTPREFDVPIDASVSRFTISASFDREGGTLNVTRARRHGQRAPARCRRDHPQLRTRPDGRQARIRPLARTRGGNGTLLAGGSRPDATCR